METSVPAAPAASSPQQQQPRLQNAPQLQHGTHETFPPELEGLLRGVQEAQSYEHGNKHMSWVRNHT